MLVISIVFLRDPNGVSAYSLITISLLQFPKEISPLNGIDPMILDIIAPSNCNRDQFYQFPFFRYN